MSKSITIHALPTYGGSSIDHGMPAMPELLGITAADPLYGGQPTVAALVDSAMPTQLYRFTAYAEHTAVPDNPGRYIGSAVVNGQALHYFAPGQL
jgi:hypothetical protein